MVVDEFFNTVRNFIFMVTIVLSGLLYSALVVNSDVFAATATVNVYLKHANGAPVAGKRVVCSGTDGAGTVSGSGNTNSSGFVAITISKDSFAGYSFRCSTSAVIPYSGCVENWTYTPAAFTLTDGGSATVNGTQTNSCVYNPSSTTPPGGSTTPPTNEPAPEPEPEPAPVASVTLPEIFLGKDSKTTDFSDLNANNAECVKDVVFEVSEFGRVEFNECLDLSTKEIADKFKQLDNYIEFRPGYIRFDSKALKELNKPATVYFYNLDLAENLVSIKKDDKNFTHEAKNLVYEESEKILSFAVEGFSTFAVYPNLQIDTDEYVGETNEKTLRVDGLVGDLNSDFAVKINEKAVEHEINIDEEGKFTITLDLTKGRNDIQIIAESQNEMSEEINFTIDYQQLNYLLLTAIIGLILFCIAVIIIFIALVRKRKKNLEKQEQSVAKKDKKNKVETKKD
jgi:hypothetical protein